MGAVMNGEAGLRGGDNRAFGFAVLASILIHGLLLLALPSLREAGKRPSVAPGPIIARLVQARPAAAPLSQAVEQAPQPGIEPPPVSVAKPAPAPRPVAKAEPRAPAKPAPAASSQPSSPAPASAPAQASAAPPGPAPGPLARVEPQPSAAAPAAETADAGTLARYRLQLISAAKRYKRYPRVAMDNNWEGKVELRMVIGANGMIASLSVKNGTGHDALDRQALDMIKKAKPLTPIPAALRGKEFSVDIPVIFSLKEPDA